LFLALGFVKSFGEGMILCSMVMWCVVTHPTENCDRCRVGLPNIKSQYVVVGNPTLRNV